MYYVYILKSDTEDWRYVGYTSDLRARLKDHNNGKVVLLQNPVVRILLKVIWLYRRKNRP